MRSSTGYARVLALLLVCVLLAACESRRFLPPDVHGASMVADGTTPRFWVLTKTEEERTVSIGSSRSSRGWRTDTYFHFDVQAFDPATARPLWKQRLMTIGDPDAKNRYQLQTRVMGSAVAATLLGQDGDVVWLLIGDEPFGLAASDGRFVADPSTLQAAHPELKGLLPSEAIHYGFDRGLVVRTADARQWVLRGGTLAAHVPTPQPPAYPEGRLKSNGSRAIVPMYPLGEIPARVVTLDGRRIGLYSEKEAADAADDEWGDHLLYPYSVLDEGALARRTFWDIRTTEATRFDDRWERFAEFVPVAGSPVYLKGRFVKDPATGLPGEALVLGDPTGVLVWHGTRMDDEGRLALARLDASLQERWKTELPLSETGTLNPVRFWRVGDHLVAMGQLQSERDHISSRTPHLVSVAIADGALSAWNLQAEAPVE
jgi:hypothetical protein